MITSLVTQTLKPKMCILGQQCKFNA